MTYTSTSRLRLLLGIATAILLLTCTAAAWALPHPIVEVPAPRTATTTADPCDLILGSARQYCLGTARADTASAGLGAGGRGPWQTWMLLFFSGTAIGAALGLATTAGRPSR